MTWGTLKRQFKNRMVKDDEEITAISAFTDTEGRRWVTFMIEDRVMGLTLLVRKP